MDDSILKADGMFEWYKPGIDLNEIKFVAGALEIGANGISTLSLLELLSEGSSGGQFIAPRRINPTQAIIGILKDGSYIFLRQIESAGISFGVLSHQRFRAREAVVFHHLGKLPELERVTKLRIDLNDLEDWASEPVVKVSRTQRGATVRAIKPKVLTFKLPSKAVHLKTSINLTPPAWAEARSATIKQETFLEMVPKSPLSLKSIREEFYLIEELLLLLADVYVTLPWPEVRYGNEVGHYYFERRRSDPQEVDIQKSWAALKWLTSNFGTLLSSLEVQKDILGPGLYLYLGIQRNPALYLENQFSTAIFGLESLHRRISTSIDQGKLAEKITRILAEVKLKKDRNWLQRRLKNAGEPSLEDRLFHTFTELDIGLDQKKLRAFSKECADLRNQIAHFGGHRDGGYDDFVRKIYQLNKAVRPLYHAVLLNRIGLDRDRIWAYFHRSPYSTQRKMELQAAGLTFIPSATPPIDG